jgi:hypothetical protein
MTRFGGLLRGHSSFSLYRYPSPTANPQVPTVFGQSLLPANSGSPVIGRDSPRETQLGLKDI